MVSPASAATHTSDPESEAVEAEPSTFEEVYDRYFDFIWRVARRSGVDTSALDDVVQEAFLVIHRRLQERRTSTLRAWIYGITAMVVRNHRRTLRRKSPHTRPDAAVEADAVADETRPGPEVDVARAQATRTLHSILQELDPEKRDVFVLVQLEQLPVTEAAEAIGVNVNTAYSRLRLARAAFDEAVSRRLARERGGRG